MFSGSVEASTDIINMRVADYFGGRDLVITRFKNRLSAPPLAGSNNIFVAHGNLARAATTVYPDEGEAIVFRPLGNNQFEFVDRLTPLQWKALADLITSEEPNFNHLRNPTFKSSNTSLIIQAHI